MLRHLACWLTLFVWTSLAAVAQDAPNFAQFNQFADSVETTIENDRLSEQGFQDLRESIVEWRSKFLNAQNINSVRIEGLKAQIDALGPAPAEGETEADNIAERRASLNSQLKEASAPRLAAEEAYARADALVGQIDAMQT